MLYIDYSAYRTFMECAWKWYEKYVNKRQKAWMGMRKDAMALGTLVHDGLRHFYANGPDISFPLISMDAVRITNPTPELLQQANMLLAGYAQWYGQDPWTMTALEKPLMRPLCGDVTLVAKVDGYFQIMEPTEIIVGPGSARMTMMLEPGWYSLEHKTKDSMISVGHWMQQWQVNLQASFQLLALEHMLNVEHQGNDHALVRGVLVNVLEKPRAYVPERKCKGCGETSEMTAWLSKPSDGLFCCPWCGYEQELKPYKPKVEHRPEYWRMLVTRTDEQLHRHLLMITDTSQDMAYMIDRAKYAPDAEDVERLGRMAGLCSIDPNLDACVDVMRRKQCEYYDVHNGPQVLNTLEEQGFVEAEDYVGEGRVGYAQ